MPESNDEAILARRDDAEALRREWGDLWRACPNATPFQHPAWLLAWWDHFTPSDVRLLTLRHAGRLVAVVPLFVWGRGATRVLALLGAGISDDLDALVAPGFAEAAIARVHAVLERSRADWDVCELDGLAEAALLTSPAPDAWESHLVPQDPCPVLPLPPHAEGLASVVPGHQLARFRKAFRRAEREASLTLDLARGPDAPRALDALLALHAARWASRGEPGVLADPKIVAFHRAVVPAFDAEGLLRLYVLRHGGASVASLYAFRAHDRLYCYLQGIDPAHEKLSPGLLALGLVLDAAQREGARAADFLRGREPYKYAWGAVDRPTLRRTLVWRAARPAGQAFRAEPAA